MVFLICAKKYHAFLLKTGNGLYFMELPIYYETRFKENLYEFRDNLVNNCEKCGGKGYIETGDNMFVDCDCVNEFNEYRQMIKLGLPLSIVENRKKYLRNYSKYFSQQTLKSIKAYFSKNLSKNVLFVRKDETSWGTDVISGYFLYKLAKEKSFMYVETSHLNELFFDFDKKYENCLDYLLSVDVLLIDNFGKFGNAKNMGNDTSFITDRTQSFLLSRRKVGKITLISSRMTKREFIYGLSPMFLREVIKPNYLVLNVETITPSGVFDGVDDEIKEYFDSVTMIPSESDKSDSYGVHLTQKKNDTKMAKGRRIE